MNDDLTPRNFEELDRLFEEAVELPEAERAALIERVRRTAPALAAQLSDLLRHDDGSTERLHGAVAGEARQVVEDHDPFLGERFGPFRAESLLGRGGMGAVYLGVRVDDAFEQRVAIKTIRAGLESPHLLERFRREREILAQLNHPAIAGLIDGGTGPRGVPFVAMEFVEGVLLLDHVRQRGLGLEQRLDLFLELCDAIEFVHRNLIVHRDIKPNNVMVTADGHLKLLDFGIAKLLDEFDGSADATATAHRVMTPEYASPEQLLGRSVTTASDVYALGVLLYELCTGTRPVQYDSRSPYALAQAIVESTPAPPSEVTLPPGARRRLRGDLDRIVMMALRKEPERRYPTVAALSADIRRFLAGEPVSAQDDTWHYRARKFLGRHPLASLAALLFLIVVVGFSVATTRQRDRALEAEDLARTKAAAATATSDFLMRLFETADPRQQGQRDVTAQDLLFTGLETLESDTTLDPRARAELHLTLGLALANLEEVELGVESLRRTVDEFERVYGPESLETAEAKHRLGDVLRRSNRREEAYDLLAEALSIRQRLIPGDSYEIADSYNNLAILAVDLGRMKEAERLQQDSVDMHVRVAGEAAPVLGTPLNNLSLLRRRQGKVDEGLRLAEWAGRVLQRSTDRSSQVVNKVQTARLLMLKRDVDRAQPLFEEARTAYVSLYGEDSNRVLGIERDIALCLQLRGNHEAARRRFDELEPKTRDDPYGHIILQRMIANLEQEVGRFDIAETLVRSALERHLGLSGPRHWRVAALRRELAELLVETGRIDEAESQIRQALAVLPEPDEFPMLETGTLYSLLGQVFLARGERDAALRSFEQARTLFAETIGTDSQEMRSLGERLAALDTPPA